MTVYLSQLRNLCALYWNPIGIPMRNVATFEELGYQPLPEDEYDTYLLEVASFVDRGVSRDDIIAHLATCEEYMGLTEPVGDKAAFVDAVVALARNE